MSSIKVESLEEMVKICAELTKEGIVFVARYGNNKMWEIEITGY